MKIIDKIQKFTINNIKTSFNYISRRYLTYNSQFKIDMNKEVREKVNLNTNLNLKAKINQFLRRAHPDVLSSNCSEELKLENQKSMQILNQFISSLNDNSDFKSVLIEFNVYNEYEEGIINRYSFDLPGLHKGKDNKNQKFWLSKKLDTILEDITSFSTLADKFGQKSFFKKEINEDNEDYYEKKDNDKELNDSQQNINKQKQDKKISAPLSKPVVNSYKDQIIKKQSQEIAEKIIRKQSEKRLVKKENYL